MKVKTFEAYAPRKRLAKPLIFCQTESDCPMENGYAQPVEGIHVLVDMQNTMGCDCLGYIKYFDAYFKNFTGGGETIGNYVCLHEKDHEMLWKHQDWRTGLAELPPSTINYVCNSFLSAHSYSPKMLYRCEGQYESQGTR
ncbi:hypothetical protein JHK87_012440 [Glycine soja]|nr:hypothetical protein JHK87_012440 [Glycine soja]